MCRLLAYLGAPIQLDRILHQPDHSLIVQSYQPKEMTAGLLNADGFGVGWYHPHQQTEPFTYKNTLPIWSDINLPSLSRYVESGCIVANIRSATPGQPVDLGNCQPFQHTLILGLHNGFIDRFRQTLYRPLRAQFTDGIYSKIGGSTDSEHLFGLVLSLWERSPHLTLMDALQHALRVVEQLATAAQVSVSANVLLSDGQQLVASRFAHGTATPSLYWLRGDRRFPDGAIIASEPLFDGDWQSFPPRSIACVGADLDFHIQPL